MTPQGAPANPQVPLVTICKPVQTQEPPQGAPNDSSGPPRDCPQNEVWVLQEELADGLHLIDFEQLKIENQSLNEKIEERNEELAKLRKKTATTVQVRRFIHVADHAGPSPNQHTSGCLSLTVQAMPVTYVIEPRSFICLLHLLTSPMLSCPVGGNRNGADRHAMLERTMAEK